MEDKKKPLPDGLNVIMHIIQNETEQVDDDKKENEECQNIKD